MKPTTTNWPFSLTREDRMLLKGYAVAVDDREHESDSHAALWADYNAMERKAKRLDLINWALWLAFWGAVLVAVAGWCR